MRQFLVFSCLLLLAACSGIGEVADGTDGGTTEGDADFDLLPVGSYDGDPLVDGSTANDISFTISELGIIEGSFVVNLVNNDDSISTRSYSFEGEVDGLRTSIGDETLNLLFDFEETGEFTVAVSGYDEGNSNRDAGLFTAAFISDTVPDEDDEDDDDTSALPAGDS